MRLFRCDVCGQLLYFENSRCEKCGHTLGYMPRANMLVALDPEGDAWRALSGDKRRYRFCANEALAACNWLIPEEHEGEFCLACRHNRTVPDLSEEKNLKKWRKIEVAKHRLIYSLLRLRLPLESNEDREGGLCFDFLADAPLGDAPKVMTGHDEGLITIALAEADDAEREQRRNDLGELYRTLLGHFRHEAAHYYWNRMVRDDGRLDACRAIFGDERADYGEALKAYYAAGPQPGWQTNFVSAYASSHPWEDFAETFKHYIHIVDTLEMAGAFGMAVRPRLDQGGELASAVDFSPYGTYPIETMVDAWLPIAFSLNSLNRCMGMADAYPFVIGPGVVPKLGFIHSLVHRKVATDESGDAPMQAVPELPPEPAEDEVRAAG